MMANQQVLFAETIAGMKKAFKRKAYESDSDTEIESYANRGHKLQKRARFAHRGQLVPSEGPSAYKESVEYANVRRSIIHRNPPLFDEDGYEVDSEDDDDRIEEAIASTADLNPYSGIRIEQLLAPLTASTDLSTHPTLSKPFISQNLNDLALQSSRMMRRENSSLWQVRHLWTSLCGDHVWVPCETMLGSNDIELYTEDHVAKYLLALAKGPVPVNDGRQLPNAMNGSARIDETVTTGGDDRDEGDVEMGGTVSIQNHVSAVDGVEHSHSRGVETAPAQLPDGLSTNAGQVAKSAPLTNGNEMHQPDVSSITQGNPSINQNSTEGGQDRLAQPQHSPPPSHPDLLDQPFIHPMFLPPDHSRADRDVGIPEAEAEDVRRLLAIFIQKQEEVCRGVTRLHDGLNRAQRLRQDVLRWSKAEAHSGTNRDMSDGEDWYDKDEWGLDEDLKKGQDDEEEDTTTTGKKTRARR